MTNQARANNLDPYSDKYPYFANKYFRGEFIAPTAADRLVDASAAKVGELVDRY